MMELIAGIAAALVAFAIGYVTGYRVASGRVSALIRKGILIPNLPLMFGGAYGAEAAAGYAHQDRTVSLDDSDADDPATRLRPRFKGPEDPTPYL